MFDYTEYFKLEAKRLFKDFHKNVKEAVSLSQAYFGDRKNLSLMNFQHIIAKKYGFNSWKELILADNGKLATILIASKNKEFTSPFSSWNGNTKLQVEDEKVNLNWNCLPRLNQLIDEHRKIIYTTPGNKSIGISDVNKPLDVNLRHANVSEYDFSNFHISKLLFNEETIWPEDNIKRPKGASPRDYLNNRRNPGLNLKSLHKSGINGSFRNIAMIGKSKLVDHLEYHHNVIDYEEAGAKYDNNGGGLAVSIAVGKKCGVAPEANIYYYAVSRDDESKGQRLADYAYFINKIGDLHEKLITNNHSGIDVICLANGMKWREMVTDQAFQKMDEAIRRAKSLGIFVISNSLNEDYGFNFGKAFCTGDGDVDNYLDYEIYGAKSATNKLYFPAGGFTAADFTKMGLYCYTPFGVCFCEWLSGLYVLAKSIKETLKPEEFWEYAKKSAYQMKNGGLLINPQGLMAKLSDINI